MGAAPRVPSTASCRGTATTLALLGTVPLLLTAGALLRVVLGHQSEAEEAFGQSRSRELARCGLHDALARLGSDPELEGSWECLLPGGSAWIEVAAWSADGVDNNGDGNIDDLEEDGLVGVRSTGWVNATLDENGQPAERPVRMYQSVAQAVLRRQEIEMEVQAAVYIDDPLSTVDLNGNAFLISGADVMADGSAGSEADLPAIGTPGDPSNMIDQISMQQADNIVGSGGPPSLGEVEVFDLEPFVAQLASQASLHVPAGSHSNLALGDRDDLEASTIAYCVGDLELTGQTSGSGFLVVDGDLTIKGGFDYAGVIACTGSVIMRGGGGTKNLKGALLCLGSVESESIEVSGTVQIEYSSSVIQVVRTELSSSYNVLQWSEE